MGNIVWTPKEIDKIKRNAFMRSNRPFVVQLMDRDSKTVIEEHRIRRWNKAHKFGARLVMKATDNCIVRIYDPEDVSCIDFLTKERVTRLNERGHYIGNEKDFEEC